MTGLVHPDDDRILELAYGELGDTEAKQLRRHVDGCPRCREVLDGIAEVRSAVRRVPPEPAPDRGLESLLAYGEQAAAQARSHRRNVRWLGLLTLATAAGLAWALVPPQRAATTSDTLARAEVPGPSADRPLPGSPPASEGRMAEQPEAKLTAKAKEKDAEKQDGALDRLAMNKRQEPVAQSVPRDAPKPADDEAARRAGAVASADVLERKAPRQQAKKAEAAAEEAPASSAELRARAPAAPAKVAAATPVASPPPASTRPAPPSVASTLAGAEKTRADAARAEADVEAGAPVQGGVIGGTVGGVAVGTFADKGGLGNAGQAGTGAKAAPARSANAASESAAGKVGADRAAQEARLAEVRRSAPAATGDARKALLFEQCRLEAALELGPSAVATCSEVAREFPGTKEAQQAVELARGFSVQLPTPPDR